ncbi:MULTISPECIES: sigma-54-dependent transcriptional regulator [Clostridium]|uniref:Predicted transcriptional regulator n=4 Tax=Clostridium TaxID=1485 RepID=D8GLR7_CLOLD|nr:MULTISPECIES: sigma-54-dependent transcriptional regulator [Clostridium]ADK13463.1 predicted transcriptional regulator [Clostridium ljungdahlii DSM 13528]OAA89082.1 Transcriptional regulatory protein ZraR [Clostridium ljungdahlii DSM 13528]OAA94262.1 Transcriptional regulatory protein ZraR [Clostridium coskatii]OBR95682.1 transcriptional regulatory protein ZraR [Clostridium coskatii]RMD04822.1 sigma-54-dependent transcriptional regulator [Clostridium autoethanogenum]
MSSKIRILAIAPYSSMEPLLIKVSKDYPNIDLTITVGDLKKGVEIAQNNFHGNYDVIISRGGTAKLLQQSVSLPVIEINTSVYDILRTLKLSDADTKKVAVVGFPNITKDLLSLMELLPYEIDIFTINSADEDISILQNLKDTGYHAILCDMITYTTARKFGMNAFLITSGIESIRDAFDTSVFYCNNYTNMRSENHFLRQLIHGRDAKTVVFTNDGKLFYSTLLDDDTDILDTLHKKIDEVLPTGKRHFLHRQNNLLYSIQGQRILSDEFEYIAFYFSVSKPPLSGNKCGINYSSSKEVEKDYFNSAYSIVGSIDKLNSTIDQVNQNFYPVMISGEEGTGKKQIAKAIYLNSPAVKQPFIEIDCTLLSDKIWDYILNNHNSPLCDSGNTIFIKNVNGLSQQQQKELLIAMTDMEICKRNRVLLSCISSSSGTLDSNMMAFINHLHCFIITLPALRDDPARIDSILKLYLNKLNISTGKQILGITPDAIQMLCGFSWPYNYTQFTRVIQNLTIITKGQYISSDEVKEVLSKEKTIFSTSFNSKYSAKLLDLSRPLSEIDKNIALKVIEVCNGNQTKAAESLKISRTTLWRLIKSK